MKFLPTLPNLKVGTTRAKLGRAKKSVVSGSRFLKIFGQKWPFAHFLPTFCPLLKSRKT
nr:MAG TPA: hypothetical protein [Caudoviricetes sp.]